MKMKKLLSLVMTVAVALSWALSVPAVAESEGKVYRTYLTSDCPILNGHDSVEISLDKMCIRDRTKSRDPVHRAAQ